MTAGGSRKKLKSDSHQPDYRGHCVVDPLQTASMVGRECFVDIPASDNTTLFVNNLINKLLLVKILFFIHVYEF